MKLTLQLQHLNLISHYQLQEPEPAHARRTRRDASTSAQGAGPHLWEVTVSLQEVSGDTGIHHSHLQERQLFFYKLEAILLQAGRNCWRLKVIKGTGTLIFRGKSITLKLHLLFSFMLPLAYSYFESSFKSNCFETIKNFCKFLSVVLKCVMLQFIPEDQIQIHSHSSMLSSGFKIQNNNSLVSSALPLFPHNSLESPGVAQTPVHKELRPTSSSSPVPSTSKTGVHSAVVFKSITNSQPWLFTQNFPHNTIQDRETVSATLPLPTSHAAYAGNCHKPRLTDQELSGLRCSSYTYAKACSKQIQTFHEGLRKHLITTGTGTLIKRPYRCSYNL